MHDNKGRRGEQLLCRGCVGWSRTTLTKVGWAVDCQAGAAKGKNEGPSVSKSVGLVIGIVFGLCVGAATVDQAVSGTLGCAVRRGTVPRLQAVRDWPQ